MLEASFGPLEPCSALRQLVASCVAPAFAKSFYLFTAPPKRRLADWDQNFYMAGFVPAARIHFGLDKAGLNSGPFLRPELLAITDMVSPLSQIGKQTPGGAEGGHGAGATLTEGRIAGPSAHDTQPREGVRSPAELRQTLAAGKKPKWLKL